MATHSFTIDSPRDTKAPQDGPAAGLPAEALSPVALAREIGRRLRAQRRARGLSQEELGWRAGYHRTHVSQIERGTCNPTLTTLYHLALALGVPLATLCPGGGPGGEGAAE